MTVVCDCLLSLAAERWDRSGELPARLKLKDPGHTRAHARWRALVFTLRTQTGRGY